MTAKSFFKKIGKSVQGGFGQATKAFGGAAGQVLGKAAGQKLLSALATQAEEGAVMALKTGGRVPGGRNKPVMFVGHGSEYVLPANAKPTKKQKAIVASNKKKQKKECKCGGFVHG